jgi:hypothetical protein
MVELPGWPMDDNIDVVKGAESGRLGRTHGPPPEQNCIGKRLLFLMSVPSTPARRQ